MTQIQSNSLFATTPHSVSAPVDDAPPRLGPVRALLARATATTDDWAAAIARVVLAAVIFPHGGQHLMGWFGGYGFSGSYGWMTSSLGIPGPAAAFSIVFEFFAPLLLLAGIGGRVLGVGFALFMLVAGQSHAANGFFMNWTHSNAGEGFEYHVLAAALALTVALRGSGALSVDRWLGRSTHE